MDRHTHWEGLYKAKAPDQVSWHQDHPALSLALIAEAGTGPDAPLIDVGGGASRLVDHLLAAGYGDLTVLDISHTALAHTRQRLGDRADAVQWIADDVTTFEPQRQYGLWHDRAVFHFLTDPDDRVRYRSVLEKALAPAGHAIIATFGPEGPTQCSGLPVVRYSPEGLQAELGHAFELLDTRREDHVTPAGKSQQFVGCLFRYRP